MRTPRRRIWLGARLIPVTLPFIAKLGYETSKLGEKVVRAKSRKQHRAPQPIPFRRRFVEAFEGDFEELSRLLGRDVSHWMTV